MQGFGGRNFYGVNGVGSEDKQADNREIDDHVYVTFEFPGPNYDKETNPEDKCIVTYSSINTNRFEPYGEMVYGSRGTLIMKTEKEAMFWRESGGGTKGGVEQRLHAVAGDDGSAPVLDTYETTAPTAAGSEVASNAASISRGYTEEMEHFCHCIREGKDELRCNGTVAMADAIMALTANLAMEHKKRIEFKDEWFDPNNAACPETDEQVTG